MKNMSVVLFGLVCEVIFISILLLSVNTVYNGVMCMAGIILSVWLSVYELDNTRRKH